jgi:large subunit ribosomal protein L10
MKLSREDKKVKSAEFALEIKGSSHLFFTEYQGLRFKDLAELRSKLKPLGLRCRVVKNSIARHAIQQAGVDGPQLEKVLSGPVALVSGAGTDPVGAAKVLVSFAKDFPQLKIRAGFVDKQWFSPEQCSQLSKLGTRVEVLTQLASVLQQSISQIASVLQAPMRDLALVLKALEEQKKKQPA